MSAEHFLTGMTAEGMPTTPPTSQFVAQSELSVSDCSAIRDFISAIVEMTDGAADINKRSIVKPGVTLRTEARRLLQRIEPHSTNVQAHARRNNEQDK